MVLHNLRMLGKWPQGQFFGLGIEGWSLVLGFGLEGGLALGLCFMIQRPCFMFNFVSVISSRLC